MSESNLSISYESIAGCFKSKNSRKRLKEELRKSYNLLENKEDFLLISNDKTGYFTKFLNPTFKLEIIKNSDSDYIAKIYEDTEEKNRLELEKQKEAKRQQLKDKLRNMKSIRSNQTGRKVKEMRKEMGDDMVKKFLEAQKAVGSQAIPDPTEIMKNKDKYIKQFQEYQTMIKDMKNKNPQMASMIAGNAYHRYANAISEKLEIPLD